MSWPTVLVCQLFSCNRASIFSVAELIENLDIDIEAKI